MTASINASTTAGVVVTSDTSGSLAIQSNGTAVATVASTGTTLAGTTALTTLTVSGTTTLTGATSITSYSPTASLLTSGTVQNSTSNAVIDFTGIPSWVKRITIIFNGVSTTGASPTMIQLGTASGFISTGYASAVMLAASASTSAQQAFTTGLGCDLTNAFVTAATVRYGRAEIYNISGNSWVSSTTTAFTGTNAGAFGGGSLTLASALTQVRITTLGGTDTFDAGTINIQYE
jgi:hypothetical protein